MGKFFEYWKMAFFNIRSNKVRAFLTMLGIIIGISSVVAVMSIGNGVKNWISGSLNGIIGSNFEVYTMGTKRIPVSTIETLCEKYDHITGFTEIYAFNGSVVRGRKEEKVMVRSGRTDLEKNNSAEILYGTYFSGEQWNEGDMVCVIDTAGAKALFGKEDAVGERLEITAYGRDFVLRVVGVRKASSTIGNLLTGTSGYSVEIPSTVTRDMFGVDLDLVSDAVIFVDSPDNVAEMSAKGRRFIEASMNERGSDTVKTYELSSSISSFSTILTAITAFVMLVAGISLFVGGVGVMNIMLVSVTERTREIGIRKSLGARTSSILWQFLIESGMISLMGGVIGILLGYGFSLLASLIVKTAAGMEIAPSFNILFMLGVAAFSMGIGVFFGLYPARKAARMTPIDALRS